MHQFTVLTPTHNRKELLQRLYGSLLRQSNKDFIWLIIDDGSTDGTEELVKKWKEEKQIDIKYIWKENEGKHIVLQMGFNMISTPYMLDIDDDDELTDDCIATFAAEWKKIKDEGREDIGSIRALVLQDDGKITGDYNPERDKGFLDIAFSDMTFKLGRHYENITSNRTDILQQAKLFHDEDLWLYSHVKNISPGIFWHRLSKITKTRYLFRPLRLYHFDAPFSIIRSAAGRKNYEQKWKNYLIADILILNEVLDYFKYRPKFFIRMFLESMAYTTASHQPYLKYAQALNNQFLKATAIVGYPLAVLLGIIVKYRKR